MKHIRRIEHQLSRNWEYKIMSELSYLSRFKSLVTLSILDLIWIFMSRVENSVLTNFESFWRLNMGIPIVN